MAGEQIEVEIDDNGNPKITVKGCPGPSCKSLTEALERDLGKVTHDQPTREMHQTANREARQR